MRKYGTIFLLLILIISCSPTIDPTDIKDVILYKNLTPSAMISTVLSYDLEDMGNCTSEIPIPEDSVITYWLDINDDQVDDFIIDVSHNRSLASEDCGECPIFEYQVTISGATDNNYISFDPTYSWVPVTYGINDTIRPASSWNKEVFLLMQGGCDRWIIDLRDSYIGIKHNNDFGWIHIGPSGNNGIEIIEHAINLTDNRPIAAGQRQ